MEIDGLIRAVARTALVPWGGTEKVLDRCEAGVRMATNAQLSFAKTVTVEPIRTIASTLAGVTRDVGAVQLSFARWFLDD
ncbi:hypothetical protein [Solirubrobacter soli]|uniref:hypothetical protein n=1 Tax=Solirubrobacter soli TaxID=363832 RepID=UPI00041DC8B2|nr:hypothetical protein [Solirubrobacter soli]